MRTRSQVLLVLLLAALCFQVGGFANAAEEEELSKFELYLEVDVKFDKIGEYVETVKEFNAFLAKYKFPYECQAYREMDKFTYCIPLDSCADLDKLHVEYMKVLKKGGDELKSINERLTSCLDSINKSFGPRLTDLWHLPENGGYEWDSDKSCYCEVWEFHLYPGARNGFMAILKEYSDLLKEKKVTQSVTFGATSIGQNLPSFWVASIAATKADHAKDSEQVKEMLGQARFDIMKKSNKFIKDIKVNRFNYDASLSYYPKK